MSQELIKRLRSHAWEPSLLRKYREEAADLIEQQTTEIERLRADAERYRWLKEHKLEHNGMVWHWLAGELLCDKDIDAAIDAALAAAPAKEPT